MTAQYIQMPIAGRRWARNGLYPDARLQNQLAAMTNFASAFRRPCLFKHGTPLASLPNGDVTLQRWRWAWNTGDYAKNLVVQMLVACRAGVEVDSATSRLRVKDGSGTVIGDADVHFGTIPGAPETPAYFSPAIAILQSGGAIVDLPTNTALYGEFIDLNGARIVAASVWETSDFTYLEENKAALSPIYDADRSSVTTMLRNLWKHDPAPLINWSSETSTAAPVNNTVSARNVIDNATTTISSATPGWTLDLRYRRRLRSSTVPCVFKAYGANGGSGTPPSVLLKDGSGTVLGTVSITGSAGWYSTTVNLPAAIAKYDIHHVGPSIGSVTTHAASLYQYES